MTEPTDEQVDDLAVVVLRADATVAKARGIARAVLAAGYVHRDSIEALPNSSHNVVKAERDAARAENERLQTQVDAVRWVTGDAGYEAARAALDGAASERTESDA